MAIELTLAKAQSMVEQAIAEKGADYVYPKSGGGACTYVDVEYVDELDYYSNEKTYEKGCLVGHIFIDAFNLDMQELAEGYVNNEGSDSFVSWLTEQGHITKADKSAVEYLNNLQRSQDAGRTWGEAHEMASQGKTWNAYKGAFEPGISF